MTERLVINQDIYPEVKVEGAVFDQLLRSVPVVRLKGINQFGVPDEFYHLKNFSRFEHSVGVMLLLKKLGASEEEQIAGLLHDVSHRALLHVYDGVVNDYTKPGNNEEAADRNHANFILDSELVSVLVNNGYDPRRIANTKNFGLLEQPSPRLCADRLDYAFREMPNELVQEFSEELIVHWGRILFVDREGAKIFGNAFLDLQKRHWGSWEATVRHHILAQTLKRALKVGIIEEQDFLTEDAAVIGKLERSQDQKIERNLGVLKLNPLPSLRGRVITIYKEFRYVDPEFFWKGTLVKLSEVDMDFKSKLVSARFSSRKGILAPVI